MGKKYKIRRVATSVGEHFSYCARRERDRGVHRAQRLQDEIFRLLGRSHPVRVDDMDRRLFTQSDQMNVEISVVPSKMRAGTVYVSNSMRGRRPCGPRQHRIDYRWYSKSLAVALLVAPCEHCGMTRIIAFTSRGTILRTELDDRWTIETASRDGR